MFHVKLKKEIMGKKLRGHPGPFIWEHPSPGSPRVGNKKEVCELAGGKIRGKRKINTPGAEGP